MVAALMMKPGRIPGSIDILAWVAQPRRLHSQERAERDRDAPSEKRSLPALARISELFSAQYRQQSGFSTTRRRGPAAGGRVRAAQ